jgi:hypothetical protein
MIDGMRYRFPDVGPKAREQAGLVRDLRNHRTGPEIHRCLAPPRANVLPFTDRKALGLAMPETLLPREAPDLAGRGALGDARLWGLGLWTPYRLRCS